jgi:creatinine amidohydrolase
MSSRPYVIAETNWSSVRETEFEVAILPWGATEAHNYHLPYATDNYQCDYVAAESARKAWEKGARVGALPTVPFGVQTGQLDIPFDVNLNPSTQTAVLEDVVDSLSRQNIPKLLVLNGHGGNSFKQMIREIQPNYPDIFICAVNWYGDEVVDRNDYFDEPGDHAGEMETSAMMHIAPELVAPLEEAGSGEEHPFTLDGLREGWVWAQREWTRATEDTGVGDPKAAAPNRGERYLDAVSDRLGAFLVDLASADPDRLYEGE